jgi:hypothetical protein
MSKDLFGRIQEIQAAAWAPVQEEMKARRRKLAEASVARWEEELAFWSNTGIPVLEKQRAKIEGELAKAKEALAALD